MNYEETKQLLLEAANSYYNQNASIMSDDKFDSLRDEFEVNFPDDPILHTIGAPVKQSPFQKALHKMPMLSLNKAKTLPELMSWSEKCGVRKFIISEKLDGISIGLEYDAGRLVKAITRGNGVKGEDITVNVNKMKNVKLKLPENFTGSLRGEIILRQTDFEEINRICEARYEEPFKNLRNGASGIAKNRHGKYCEYLTIIYYDCTGTFDTKNKKFVYMAGILGLTTCLVATEQTIEQCFALSQKYEKIIRAELDHEIDGLVIEVDSMEAYTQLGQLHKRPKGGIALKFSSMKKQTVLLGVTWQLGTQGLLTPVATLTPVNLGGVTVGKASLANLSRFKELGLRYSDVVIVSRRNDVIPYVEEVFRDHEFLLANSAKGDLIPVLSRCPTCNEKTEESGKFLICPNMECSGKALGDLKKWIIKIGVKGQGVGDSTIEKLFEIGLLKTPDDFYKLQQNDIARLSGFGVRSAEKLLDALRGKMALTLPEFVGGLNIKNFSSSMAEILMEHGYETIEQFLNIEFTDLIKIKGIEVTTANAFIAGMASKLELIENLLEVGITIIEEDEPATILVSDGGFDDLEFTHESFVFTGKFEKLDDSGARYTRKLLEELVLTNGGTIGKAVKKGLTYLVQSDPTSMSSKSRKAVKLGIQVLGEEKFFARLKM